MKGYSEERWEFLSFFAAVFAAWLMRDALVGWESLSPINWHNARFLDHMPKVVPISGKTIGANVYFLNVQKALHDKPTIAFLREALEKHLVLIVHNVSQSMTPRVQLEFSRMFGQVDRRLSSPPRYIYGGVFNSPDAVARARAAGAADRELQSTMIQANLQSSGTEPLPPEITKIVKDPKDFLAFGEGWHTDLTFNKLAPVFASLASRQLPPVGQGNTEFSDMREAWARLPQEVANRVQSLWANHSDGQGRYSIHPVVRRGANDGRGVLYVNKAFTKFLVADERGTPLEPSTSFGTRQDLREVLDFIDNMPKNHPHATLSVSWYPGQMVMWDNRYTQHSATADYQERREVHRVIIGSEVPRQFIEQGPHV